jgi:hypothetical protein
MNDNALDRLLATTAATVVYPATPDVSARVASRLAAAAPVRPSMPRLSPAYVLAAVLLVVVVALALNPSRDAIARFFGVEGSKIEVVPTLAPGITPTPFPSPNAGSPTRTISPVSLADLPRLAGFAAALPRIADPRLSSALVFYGEQPVVVHYYSGFDVWQTRLPQEASFGKLIQPDSIEMAVSVNGENGVWLSGADHTVYYAKPDGSFVPGSNRTVTRSTLIWRTDAFFYRIETDLSLQDTLRIAETLP